jgi:protein-S-isoprenylcysteine O-methyltransferase Ste14
LTVRELPAIVLGITIATYWLYVGRMVVRVGRKNRGISRMLVPAQRRERTMWIVWVPLVVAWIAMPFVASAQDPVRHPWIGIPALAVWHPVVYVLRLVASAIAIVCFLVSVQCWRHMGKDWRMGVDPAGERKLITNGPFARVRHPIYALSVALMLCSVVVVPTPVMLAIAALHILLMHLKARNEEAFLQRMHGPSYSAYCQRTGRFLPRIRPSG